MFTLQNFKRKVYPINSLVPAFFFRAKIQLRSKDTNLHLLLLLCIQMKLDECFSWWDYCLPYHVRPHLICETWSPKNREILAKFGWSTYTLNTLYFVLYISNISKWNSTRPKKPVIDKRMTYLYLFVLVPNNYNYHEKKETVKRNAVHRSYLIQVDENLEQRSSFFSSISFIRQ